ncbi:hypothetical protein [Acinetobacter baumannii]|uniref:hypothetical protein n=1 Tax=Acinetobacter baumannii TaxID=470 RepID=UPI0013CF9DFB|nr:hypothetical protein [Acinetobacter baumannii]EGY5283238.1 hypothetical protein [Acinetobacter baumannii]EIB6746869.1 hypothetical protein [Acinetobacter baumannii]MBC6334958.1 hypothetical protein [Acinetobacter baumannii]MDC4428026.1 hypothetical protein [Acinetobacter baumannii]MDC4547514.1 hypothetical protein [Acinetobacter baumannii]
MGIAEIIQIVDDYFRPLIIVLSTAITILLSSKKIGNSVAAYYSSSWNSLSAERIDDIVLINYKDKPVPIFGIYAVFDKQYILEVEKCDPPIIIEPYGSVSIKTKPHSKLYINEDEYEPDYMKATLLLDSVGKMIKCKSYKKNLIGSPDFKQIGKFTNRFNGVVHAGRHPYVLTYITNGELKTTFINKSGFLEHEWNFPFNGINLQGQELNESLINNFLIEQGYSEVMTNYSISKLINGKYILVLSKPV